ncbi:MAG: sugar phosphate isomerase/epimerase [Gemmatimonadota bacterium]|nr:sugar phosphate isomerase/epimerase [Gemmatimonadota bacterium]
MEISVFVDEIDRYDPARAIALAAEWGVSHVELRQLAGGRFPAVEDDELEAFHARVRDAGLGISGVSPGFFKGPLEDPRIDEHLRESLPRACEWALRLGTDRMSCFAFERTAAPRPPAAVVDRLGQMADIAAREGCRLALENEAVCWGATGAEAASLIRQVGEDRISLCWDPGNSARAGTRSPYPAEYADLKELITHVHVKNFNPDTGGWSLAESGLVDWPGQLDALCAHGYSGFVVVETHLDISPDAFEVADHGFKGLAANSLRNLEYIRSCLGVPGRDNK